MAWRDGEGETGGRWGGRNQDVAMSKITERVHRSRRLADTRRPLFFGDEIAARALHRDLGVAELAPVAVDLAARRIRAFTRSAARRAGEGVRHYR